MVKTSKKVTVVALGGNALLRPGQKGSPAQQMENVVATTEQLADMVLSGEYKIVAAHGNGPQVGNILLQNEIAKDTVPPVPLDVCGAESQGQIGYMLAQSLKNAFADGERGDIPVATVLTQTLVDQDDPAFDKPTKPVGPFYTAEEAEKIKKEKGYDMVEDSGRGYRRVVPSPKPLAIIEREPIRQLLDAHTVVIASGGGGIPVIEKQGRLEGCEAVVDKDLASEKMAEDVQAEILLILTDVDGVYLNYGQENQVLLDTLDTKEAKKYLEEGHFAPGSMQPKVEAGVKFVEDGGERTVITSLNKIMEALGGEAGTSIIAD